jgi:uncharacterized protein YyaL (SSP411 family)
VRDAWTTRRTGVEQQAEALLAQIREGLAAAPHRPAGRLHDQAVTQPRVASMKPMAASSAPKFPRSPLYRYQLAPPATGAMLARANGRQRMVDQSVAASRAIRPTNVACPLQKMCDNPQLAHLRRRIRCWCGCMSPDTLAWLQRSARPRAAIGSAQDADSSVEGKFYVWTAAGFRAILGTDAGPAARLYGVTDDGNWEHGFNILERRDPESVRSALGLDESAWTQWEQSVRERLYAVRSQRIWPITDDKVLADWNGMALRAFAEAGRLLDRDDFVETARSLARFLSARW